MSGSTSIECDGTLAPRGRRSSERLWPAVLIDVLLGWTVVGWLAAMILALIPPRPMVSSPQGGAGRVEPAPSAPVA
ncbi:superinfection immunity protein [Nesterenkonia halophila]